MYAAEGQCFVVAPCATVSKEMVDMLCTDATKQQLLLAGGGFARIFGPTGRRSASRCPRTRKVSSSPTSTSE